MVAVRAHVTPKSVDLYAAPVPLAQPAAYTMFRWLGATARA
jgi:hypothetical protein